MTTINTLSISRLAEMMGSEATTDEARTMLDMLRRDCVVDTDDLSESAWAVYLEEAVSQCA